MYSLHDDGAIRRRYGENVRHPLGEKFSRSMCEQRNTLESRLQFQAQFYSEIRLCLPMSSHNTVCGLDSGQVKILQVEFRPCHLAGLRGRLLESVLVMSTSFWGIDPSEK